ncbi:MAG TPA: carbamoyltransferase C-terminal domain-containing protein [Streptosporangiaceae bacterium]|nr:carbamoyltransferase C-terminal domain-containing protein [Streptosporangiaceae bacterium]
MTNSPIYVLGSGLSHDGSVCLLADGKVVLAIEKERVTRVKHDGGNDRAAMQYVLDWAGITLDDVALVVQNENFGMFCGGNATYNNEARLLTDATRVVTISHHLAHAYSAFGASGFDQASVLVIDGCGNSFEDCMDIVPGALLGDVPAGLGHVHYEKDSYYACADGTLRTVAKDFSPWGAQGRPLSPPFTLHSIGGVYQAFSLYVFGDFGDSGKLMGLAPFGELGKYDFPLFDLRDGRVFLRREALDNFPKPAKSRNSLKADFQYYANVAKYVQSEIERALLYVVNDRFERSPAPNLAYAGGVALNAVANTRILRESGFERLYIQPAAGDNGLAIGCAYYGWLEVLGREIARGDGTTYYGPVYPADRVKRAVAECGDRVTVEPSPELEKDVARLLADGKVVAWYRGGSEFGPRALGHRSILAHPGIPGLGDHINKNIKFREDFRPFAPSVIADEASRYFDCGDYDSPHMILVFKVRPRYRELLANVVHRDDSSRLHTVTQESEPAYFRLLHEFKALTGLPVLLNTSLNKRGMPIVETPEEALSFFLDCALDALVLDDMLILKSAVRPVSPERIRGLIERPSPRHIPLMGMRVASVSLTHALEHATASELGQSEGKLLISFNDTPATYNVAGPPELTMRFFRLCDGVRTYGQIAASLGISTDAIIETAAPLTKLGILDHAPSPSPA